MDFPVTLEALSAPADLVELGLTLLRRGVEWAVGSDLQCWDFYIITRLVSCCQYYRNFSANNIFKYFTSLRSSCLQDWRLRSMIRSLSWPKISSFLYFLFSESARVVFQDFGRLHPRQHLIRHPPPLVCHCLAWSSDLCHCGCWFPHFLFYHRWQ